MSKRAIILSGFLVLALVLLTRSLGIHIDENNYLGAAGTAPLGDSAMSGKPYLFYLLNYVLYNSVGFLFGSLRPLSLYFVYLVFWTGCLAWTAAKIAPRDKEFAWAFALLVLSPLCLLNSTQIMMENPILPLLALTFGSLLRPRHEKKQDAVLFASALAEMLLKETAIPAVLALLVAFRSRVLAAAVAAAVVLRFALLALIGAPLSHYDGKLGNLFDFGFLLNRAENAPSYLWLWIFFASIPGALACVFFLYRPEKESRRILAVAALSLLGVFALMLLMTEDLARYCYPCLWVGTLAAIWLVLRLPKAVAALVLASSVLSAANLWDFGTSRLALWPSMVSRELYYSGYTVLPGVALHGWTLLAGPRRKNMCILIAQQNSEKSWAIAKYLAHISENPRFFSEANASEFEKCDGPKAILRRQYQQDPRDCVPACPKPRFSVDNCTPQEMRGWAAYSQTLTNRSCLP